MSAARRAGNLYPLHAEGVVLMTADRTRNCCSESQRLLLTYVSELTVEECRPTTSALELGRALVQGSTAPSAGIDAFIVVLVVLACAGRLCALLA